MINWNIKPGTKVRNLKTGKVRTYESRASVNGKAPVAHLSGIHKMHWENFDRNHELANQSNPSLMTSIG